MTYVSTELVEPLKCLYQVSYSNMYMRVSDSAKYLFYV